MNEKGSALIELDSLLSSRLYPLLKTIPDSTKTIATILEETESAFHSKRETFLKNERAQLGIDNKVTNIENHIKSSADWKTFYTVKDLEWNTEVARKIISAAPVGMFISQEAAKTILEKHPPTRLKSALSALKITDDPLTQLSLTRHTESAEWQHTYSALLSTLDEKSFEKRSISHRIFDSDSLKRLLADSGQRNKPWRISHNKEAGIINCFTHPRDEVLVAPYTQHVLVFLHYFFETVAAGSFITDTINTSPTLTGHRIQQMIHTNTDKFDFFHPNAYSEHLFWEQALSEFCKKYSDCPDVIFFQETIACGGYVLPTDPEPTSLNLIDRVWDVNLSPRAELESYFGFQPKRFTYHFKEALWYKAICRLARLHHEDAQRLVLGNINRGDKTLTNLLLKHHETDSCIHS